jgi:hypothetical protein
MILRLPFPHFGSYFGEQKRATHFLLPLIFSIQAFNHRYLMSNKPYILHQTVAHNPIETQNEKSRP